MSHLQKLEYPRHVHRYHPDGPAHPGAWKVVPDAAACALALEDGWALLPVLEPPDAPAVPAPDVEPVKPKRRGRKGDA